jgi:hypothetical protein
MSIDTEPRTEAARPPVRFAGRPARVANDGLPRLPGRRNPRWIALGIVALCLGALLSSVIYARVASETTVVSAARTVYRGQVLERADLTTVRLRGGTLPDTVPAAELERLVGQRAVFDLPAGAVVAGAAVAPSALPGEGRAAVGLKLATGRAPEALLLPSSPVRLVALPPASTEAAADDKLAGKTYPARVIGHAPGADGVSLVLDVDVAATQAPTIALLGAQDRLAVVRDAGR